MNPGAPADATNPLGNGKLDNGKSVEHRTKITPESKVQTKVLIGKI